MIAVENSKETIAEHVRVYIRQRPKQHSNNDGEINHAQSSIKSSSSDGDCTYISPLSKKQHDFKFEGFLNDKTEQCEVFDRIAKPIVESALKGYSGTIFAYGPTNSGKTHTIRGGDHSELGIMPR